MQRVVPLVVVAFGVLEPVPAFHAGIGTIVYFAKVLHPDEETIAIERETVYRITDQLLFVGDRILLPLTL